MLLDLVSPLFRARLSLEFEKSSIDRAYYPLRSMYDMDFTVSYTIVTSLHRLKVYIFKLFILLASCSYAT